MHAYQFLGARLGSKNGREVIQISGIVPFVATTLKGRFVVFLKWLLIHFMLYLDEWLPHRVRQLAPQGLKTGEKLLWKKRPFRSVATKGTILIIFNLKKLYIHKPFNPETKVQGCLFVLVCICVFITKDFESHCTEISHMSTVQGRFLRGGYHHHPKRNRY